MPACGSASLLLVCLHSAPEPRQWCDNGRHPGCPQLQRRQLHRRARRVVERRAQWHLQRRLRPHGLGAAHGDAAGGLSRRLHQCACPLNASALFACSGNACCRQGSRHASRALTDTARALPADGSRLNPSSPHDAQGNPTFGNTVPYAPVSPGPCDPVPSPSPSPPPPPYAINHPDDFLAAWNAGNAPSSVNPCLAFNLCNWVGAATDADPFVNCRCGRAPGQSPRAQRACCAAARQAHAAVCVRTRARVGSPAKASPMRLPGCAPPPRRRSFYQAGFKCVAPGACRAAPLA